MILAADFDAAVACYTAVIGFAAAFTHGEPPFYGQIRHDAHVSIFPPHPPGTRRSHSPQGRGLIAAVIPVHEVDALHEEFGRAGARFRHAPGTEPRGLRTFIVLDPDDNLILSAGKPG